MTTLPPAHTEALFDSIDPGALLAGVRSLCADLDLPTDDLTRFAEGSVPVYAIGATLVLKLYPAVYPKDLPVERDMLRALHGRLPIPTPGVVSTGERDGWGYILMERLHGETLKDAWPRIPAADRLRLAGDLGRALAVLHSLDGPDLGPPDWEWFLVRQRGRCVQAQREKGLSEEWLAQIPGFLASVVLPPGEHVLLHTEVMGGHLLVAEGPGGWEFTGLYDFEPAMRGAREYEFVGVGIFVSQGDPAVLRSVLAGYGHDGDPELPRRLMAYTLLHVYSNLPWFLKELPSSSTTLDGLAEDWFGITVR